MEHPLCSHEELWGRQGRSFLWDFWMLISKAWRGQALSELRSAVTVMRREILSRVASLKEDAVIVHSPRAASTFTLPLPTGPENCFCVLDLRSVLRRSPGLLWTGWMRTGNSYFDLPALLYPADPYGHSVWACPSGCAAWPGLPGHRRGQHSSSKASKPCPWASQSLSCLITADLTFQRSWKMSLAFPFDCGSHLHEVQIDQWEAGAAGHPWLSVIVFF